MSVVLDLDPQGFVSTTVVLDPDLQGLVSLH